MFEFLRRRKVTIDAVSVPDLGLELKVDTASKKLWVDPARPLGVSLSYFEMKPDIPPLKDVEALRAFYRKLAAEAQGGILEVEVVNFQGFSAAKTLLKVPQQPSGISYLASLTLPFRDCSFVLKVEAVEIGTTGFRDTLVLDRLMEAGVVKLRDDGLHGWMRDPYAPEHRVGKLMNLSEAEEYDAEFPEHALTNVRRVFRQVLAGVVLHGDLKRLKGFD